MHCMVQDSELKRYNLETASIRPPFKLFTVTYKLMGIRLTSDCNPEVTSGANISGAVVGDELKIFPGIE
jgi:hypothetical protein